MSGFERPVLEQDGIILITSGGQEYKLGLDKDIAEFRYMEDMNMGYPVLEIVITEALYSKLNAGLIGSGLISVKNLKYDKFEIKDTTFRIKAIGVATPIMNKPGHVNFIKLICHHLDQERLMNLNKSILPKGCPVERRVSDVVEMAHTEANCKLGNIVERTMKLKDFTRWNLYIPSTADAQKVIGKMAHTAMSTSKRGGYMYFYNRDAMHFETAQRVMSNEYDEEIKILEGRNDYVPYDIKLAPQNDFPAITLGNRKRIIAYYYTIKEPWRYDASNLMTYPNLHASNITQLSSNAGRGLRSYYCHCDHEDEVKAFAESMYLAQIFNISLDLKMMVNRCGNFKIGQVIPVKFLNASPDQELYHNMSDKWLIKSLVFRYTTQAVNLDLKLVRAGINHRAGQFAPA